MTAKKIFTLFLYAFAIFAGAFSFPAEVRAEQIFQNNVAPPTVHAEIVGSLLRIEATDGFYPIEAVFINGRRFNFRVDSALLIDISGYIASGNSIAIYAVDFAGNVSSTVFLTPPPSIQPPQPNNLTPEGQAQVIDHATNEDEIEFLTINTPAGNTFFLVIDHTRQGNNVYFLNAVTEWDLMTLAAAAELPAPPIFEPPPVPEIPIEPPEEPPEPTPAPAENSGGGMGMYVLLGLAGAGVFAAAYYFKIVKPKQAKQAQAENNADSDDDDDNGEEDDDSDEENDSDDDYDDADGDSDDEEIDSVVLPEDKENSSPADETPPTDNETEEQQ